MGNPNFLCRSIVIMFILTFPFNRTSFTKFLPKHLDNCHVGIYLVTKAMVGVGFIKIIEGLMGKKICKDIFFKM